MPLAGYAGSCPPAGEVKVVVLVTCTVAVVGALLEVVTMVAARWRLALRLLQHRAMRQSETGMTTKRTKPAIDTAIAVAATLAVRRNKFISIHPRQTLAWVKYLLGEGR